MFKNAGVPILGIVENMSYFICPRCSTRTDIFAHGGGEQAAVNLGIPFLGQIPLDPIGENWG
jgi:ATP-binding protein involved in chromosome partitioning